MSEPAIVQMNIPPGTIDLGLGNPDFNLLPVEALRRSAELYFRSRDPRPLQYGHEQGDGYFREALADFLTREYSARVDPNLLFVTSGASAALDLLCTLYTRPGDTIFVEEPSYFLALRIFADHGLRVKAVPMDGEGMQIEALEELLTQDQPRFLYTIPTFQNPSGRTLSASRREALVALAQEGHFLVVADEVYHFLSYAQAPPKPLAAFAGEVEEVVSLNSFSKILAPGLRLGWVQAHGEVIERLTGSGLLDSGGGLAPFTAALSRGLVESGGLAENIDALRVAYAGRLKAMDEALAQYLPQAEYHRPTGGFFTWTRLPGQNAVELRGRAREFGVDFRPGVLFSSRAGLEEYMRLGFCFYGTDQIGEGVKRLADCLSAGETNAGR